MAEYKPLFVYLEPASIPQVVSHIQKYLAENPIVSDPEEIAEAIQKYIEEHPEIIAVASVNGKTGTVVLTGSDININASSAVSIETQLSNLASMINSVGADITQIEANISQIYTTIGTLQTNVETNASNISALQTSVEGQGTRLATAETDIDNLETAQTAQGTRLNTAEGNISSLQTRMTQAETDIDTNENAIETNRTNIQTINTSFSTPSSANVSQNRVSEGDLFYYKINNCVFVYGAFKIASSDVGGGLGIFASLPKPKSRKSVALVGTKEGTTTTIHAYVNSNGAVLTCQALTADTWYNLNGFYDA